MSEHPIRKGAILKLVDEAEQCDPVVSVVQRLRDIDSGTIYYDLQDPTLTSYYTYHQDDVDALFADSRLTHKGRGKPIGDSAIQAYCEFYCDHSWSVCHDPDTLEEAGFLCSKCYAERDSIGGEQE